MAPHPSRGTAAAARCAGNGAEAAGCGFSFPPCHGRHGEMSPALTGNIPSSHWGGDWSLPSTPEGSARPGDIGAVSPLPCAGWELGRELRLAKPLGQSRACFPPGDGRIRHLRSKESSPRCRLPPWDPRAGLSSPGCWAGGSAVWVQPRLGASTLSPAAARAPPGRVALRGGPHEKMSEGRAGPHGRSSHPEGQSRVAPSAVPCPWLGRGCRDPSATPPAVPTAALAACPMPQEAVPPTLAGTWSPCQIIAGLNIVLLVAGDPPRTPAQSRPLPGGPCHPDPLPGCCGAMGSSAHLHPSPGTPFPGLGLSQARLSGLGEG